jgi:hypothetical protein
MALSGACPGTVFPQVVLGVPSGLSTIAGGLLGGIFWSGWLRPRLGPQARGACGYEKGGEEHNVQDVFNTVYHALGIRKTTALVLFEAICATVVLGFLALTKPGVEPKISPVAGGALIAAAQLASVLVRKSMVGLSAAYVQFGDAFLNSLKGRALNQIRHMLFAAGVGGGAWLLGTLVPGLVETVPMEISPVAASFGGFLMVVGSQVAGGCTSGHGISGISMLSTSSIVTIGTAFGFGAILRLMMG